MNILIMSLATILTFSVMFLEEVKSSIRDTLMTLNQEQLCGLIDHLSKAVKPGDLELLEISTEIYKEKVSKTTNKGLGFIVMDNNKSIPECKAVFPKRGLIRDKRALPGKTSTLRLLRNHVSSGFRSFESMLKNEKSCTVRSKLFKSNCIISVTREFNRINRHISGILSRTVLNVVPNFENVGSPMGISWVFNLGNGSLTAGTVFNEGKWNMILSSSNESEWTLKEPSPIIPGMNMIRVGLALIDMGDNLNVVFSINEVVIAVSRPQAHCMNYRIVKHGSNPDILTKVRKIKVDRSIKSKGDASYELRCLDFSFCNTLRNF